jgi:hypothetical protein
MKNTERLSDDAKTLLSEIIGVLFSKKATITLTPDGNYRLIYPYNLDRFFMDFYKTREEAEKEAEKIKKEMEKESLS